MKRIITLITATLTAMALSHCGKSPQAEAGKATQARNGKPVVYVANYPLKYFAEQIAGGAAEIVFPDTGGEDPAFWQPDDKTIAAFQGADLILMNGATYSKWAEKVTLPASKLVDTSAGFKANFIEVKDSVTHSHGPGGDHSHSGTAFTTWIDFNQAIAQAAATRIALGRVLPDAGEALDANLKKLTDALAALDARMKAAGARMSNAPVMASHPVYQYFARRYSINLKAVLWEPETVPDDKALEGLRQIVAAHPAKWMIWEGEPAKESVDKLKALGIASIVFDPCGNTPDAGDFISMMRANVEAMEKAFP